MHPHVKIFSPNNCYIASGRDLGIRKKNEILAHLQNITGLNTQNEEGKAILLSNRLVSFLCTFLSSLQSCQLLPKVGSLAKV